MRPETFQPGMPPVKATPRVVIYVKDHGTSGPIARAAQVAHALRARGAEVSVMLREEIADTAMLGEGVDVVPYCQPKGWLPQRRDATTQLKKLRPDVLLVDEYPFVNQHDAPEWERVINAARRGNPTLYVAGMACDIPIYPKDIEAVHLPKRARLVQDVMVTGDPSVIDFAQDYVQPGMAADSVRSKLAYVGFMHPTPALHADRASHESAHRTPHVLVYLGGHAQDHARQYLSLLANLPQMDGPLREAHWEFVLPAQQHLMVHTKIEALYQRLPEEIRAHVTLSAAGSAQQFSQKLQQADMAITGGGQTAIESALVHGMPTMIVPTNNAEQIHRAHRFTKAMPERVVGMHIPAPREKKMTRERLVYETYHAKDARDWIDKLFDWAAENADASAMRAHMQRLFEKRTQDVPNTQIMLDGAERIAERITQQHAGRAG